MVSAQSYRVFLGDDWDLDDLYEYPHALSQCYAFVYCLDSKLEPYDSERIASAMHSYPFRGGFSYVNIYSVLKAQIPRRDRPKIASIKKASPGWLDLFLNVDVAYHLAGSVTSLAAAGYGAVVTYKKAYQLVLSINEERRKSQVENMKLDAMQMKMFNLLCVEIAKSLGFKNLKELHEYTGNPEVSLKLLMAHYRKMETLLKYEQQGKASLSR